MERVMGRSTRHVPQERLARAQHGLAGITPMYEFSGQAREARRPARPAGRLNKTRQPPLLVLLTERRLLATVATPEYKSKCPGTNFIIFF